MPEDFREQGYGPYVSHGTRRMRERYRSPDPSMFRTTIFLGHDPEYSAAGGDPIRQVQERLMCVEHNIETLRTRVTQVADLRDSLFRLYHHSIVARRNEVEEYASANTFRELMTRIQRLESMLVGNGGGTVGEAIRVCSRRIDQQQTLLDEMQNRLRVQDENVEDLMRTPKMSLAEKIELWTEDEEGVHYPMESGEILCLDHHHKPLNQKQHNKQCNDCMLHTTSV